MRNQVDCISMDRVISSTNSSLWLSWEWLRAIRTRKRSNPINGKWPERFTLASPWLARSILTKTLIDQRPRMLTQIQCSLSLSRVLTWESWTYIRAISLSLVLRSLLKVPLVNQKLKRVVMMTTTMMMKTMTTTMMTTMMMMALRKSRRASRHKRADSSWHLSTYSWNIILRTTYQISSTPCTRIAPYHK